MLAHVVLAGEVEPRHTILAGSTHPRLGAQCATRRHRLLLLLLVLLLLLLVRGIVEFVVSLPRFKY